VISSLLKRNIGHRTLEGKNFPYFTILCNADLLYFQQNKEKEALQLEVWHKW
jgi:hypothetical protein